MLVESKDLVEVSNVMSFVRKFKLQKQFKKEYGMDIEDWDFTESDGEVIGHLLEKSKETYFVVYVEEHDGYFKIYKI